MGKFSLSFLLLFLMALALQNGTCNAVAPRKAVGIYELKKGNFSVKVTNWGAIITSVIVPDSKGNLADVVLGYDRLGPYINNSVYFGALVGRVANRIAGGRFVLNGTVHKLYRNDGNNSLHGGHRGFSRVIWTVKKIVRGEFPSITLYYRSFDGEQGFPGDLDVYVTYSISGDYQLSVSMRGKSLTEATPVNLAQHTYWNLRGHDGGSILSHRVRIFASRITPVDADLIPTGELAPVQGTPFDFLRPETVGSRIDRVPGGYDINYVVDSWEGKRWLSRVATVTAEETGRRMELWADQQGVQFYTGNFLRGVKGKGGAVYEQHAGLCLETQGFPDAVNHPKFPSQIVAAGEEYHHNMLYQFSF
ncbi:galactose mutarotase-like [Zingiber officinale]|uniref:Aldose 1-epimerase n=1 Tax=Zingiber officinale TaxID=94328 RepID=A0A8J5KT96_ZINOF|nr:galactose mutarotase-like [Zingiber officinale]KAG6494402.1 hypothetical protein ZIOFF_049427 [Zingiber officinale]